MRLVHWLPHHDPGGHINKVHTNSFRDEREGSRGTQVTLYHLRQKYMVLSNQQPYLTNYKYKPECKLKSLAWFISSWPNDSIKNIIYRVNKEKKKTNSSFGIKNVSKCCWSTGPEKLMFKFIYFEVIVTFFMKNCEPITYHNIIAFHQKLSVKWPWNLKRLRNFLCSSLHLK